MTNRNSILSEFKASLSRRNWRNNNAKLGEIHPFLQFLAGSVLIFTVLNLLAWGAVSYNWVPNSAEAIRNPKFRRAWASYTDGPVKAGRDIILVSNSQGYGREMPEEAIYGHQLQDILDRRSNSGNQVLIHNWSMPGASYSDIILGVAKALEKRPRVLVISTYIGNFQLLNIRQSAFDTSRFLADRALLKHLPESVREAIISPGEMTSSYLKRLFPLFRLREYVVDQIRLCLLNPILPPDLQALGRESSDFVRPDTPFPIWDDALPPSLYSLAEHDSMAVKLLAEVLATAPMETQVILVEMPLCVPCITAESKDKLKSFDHDLRAAVQPLGVTVVNATDSLNFRHFYNGSFTHYDPTNHRAFAAQLADILPGERK